MSKQVIFSEVGRVKRPVGKPCERYKDCVKNSLKKADFDPMMWEEKTKAREPWRDEVMQVVKGSEERRNDYAEVNHAAKYGVIVTSLPQKGSKIILACNICGHTCLDKAGLTSHSNSHELPDAAALLENFICAVCGRV